DCHANRQDMFDAFDATQPLYRYVAKLNQIRATTAALRLGDQHERWQDNTAYAFERESGASTAVVVLNLAGEPRTFALHVTSPPGTVLHDSLGSAGSVTVGAGGEQSVTVTS